MGKVGPVVVAAVCCLAAIDALLALNVQLRSKKISAQRRQVSINTTNSQVLEEVQNKCTPGKFYKRGCKRCFCDGNQRPVCGRTGDCKLANKYPTKPSFLHSYSSSELQQLPSLPHQSSNCTPGVTYRVDCDACICLANKNLMCNDLLCPSYEDINRILAKEMTGNKCALGRNNTGECISCSCVKGILKCEAQSNCIPNGRRDFQYQPPLDLDVKENRQCSKGMVYKRDCNRCYCQKDNTLRCTLMRCLKHTEVQRLKMLRMQLERDGL
ncbi:uncharacterized protein LOC134800794 isoform X1 [Cydia splendana]|uniref:uncharacterized protein LOC134800794 isoform X1 n=1 Tax=Cydia splendana TaxID=1100963 RepID=UPI00300CEBBB